MRKLIIANFKTYLTVEEAIILCENLVEQDNIIIAPSMIHTALLAKKFPQLKIASQDVSALTKEYGTYTGETPALLLHDSNIRYSIIGHSERRASGLDNKTTIAKKLNFCVGAGITPIICIGETLQDRENNTYLEVITSQIESLGLSDLFYIKQGLIIAYEPTWSVGTGILPSLEQIQEIMNVIKSTIKFVDNKTILVYGGSVNAENASNILSIAEVGGLLIGKASTDITHLRPILNII